MSLPRSKLPLSVTRGYWAEVRKLLQTNHRLSPSAASAAIKTYRANLDDEGVLDEIYHAPVTETANGIAQGGYTIDNESKPARSTPRRVKKVHV